MVPGDEGVLEVLGSSLSQQKYRQLHRRRRSWLAIFRRSLRPAVFAWFLRSNECEVASAMPVACRDRVPLGLIKKIDRNGDRKLA